MAAGAEDPATYEEMSSLREAVIHLQNDLKVQTAAREENDRHVVQVVNALKEAIDFEKKERLDKESEIDEFMEMTSALLQKSEANFGAMRMPGGALRSDVQIDLPRLASMTEECYSSLRKASEAFEREKEDRIADHIMLQQSIQNFQYDFAAERGERDMLRCELTAMRTEIHPHLALKKDSQGATDCTSTEAGTTQGGSMHSQRGEPNCGPEIDDILDERMSIGDTASLHQDRSDTNIGFLDVLSKKVRDEVAQVFGTGRKELKDLISTYAMEEKMTRETTFALLQKRLHRLEHIVVGQDTDLVFLPKQGLLPKIDWMKEQVDAFARLREKIEATFDQDLPSKHEFDTFVAQTVAFREDVDSQFRGLSSVPGSVSVSASGAGHGADHPALVTREEFERNSQRVWDAVMRIQTQRMTEALQPKADVVSGDKVARAVAGKQPPSPRRQSSRTPIPSATPCAVKSTTPTTPAPSWLAQSSGKHIGLARTPYSATAKNTPCLTATPSSGTRSTSDALGNSGPGVCRQPSVPASLLVKPGEKHHHALSQPSVPAALQADWQSHLRSAQRAPELSPRASTPRSMLRNTPRPGLGGRQRSVGSTSNEDNSSTLASA